MHGVFVGGAAPLICTALPAVPVVFWFSVGIKAATSCVVGTVLRADTIWADVAEVEVVGEVAFTIPEDGRVAPLLTTEVRTPAAQVTVMPSQRTMPDVDADAVGSRVALTIPLCRLAALAAYASALVSAFAAAPEAS